MTTIIVHCKAFLQFCAKLHKRPFHYNFNLSSTHAGIIGHRAFQTYPVNCDKIFNNFENNFAHSVLRNNENYRVLRGEENIDFADAIQNIEIDLTQNWHELTTDSILKHFELIGAYCKNCELLLSEERFDDFVDVFTERCADFTDDQLLKALKILINYPQVGGPISRNYVELWNALDNACVGRMDDWDLDKILYVCDHWNALNLGKLSKFTFKSNYKIGRKIRSMAPHHLVQTLFYHNTLRNPMIRTIDAETNLSKSIALLSLNEIAIACNAFSKTKTSLKNSDLLRKIYQRLMQEIDTVGDIAFVSITKILKSSTKVHDFEMMEEFLDVAGGQISRLNLLSCLHLLLLGTHIQVCQQKLIETIVHRFVNDLKAPRLKDFEHIAFVLGLFDFQSESRIEDEFCRNLLVELKNRNKEIVSYPRGLALCLHYLTMKGFHDEELISVALKPSFLKLAYGNNLDSGRNTFSLDAYAQINLKDTYKGDFLLDKQRQYMSKTLSQYIPNRSGKFKLSLVDNILLEIKETSEELYNSCYFAHVLPHFDRPDLIIAYNKSTKIGIDIGVNCPTFFSGKIINRAMLTHGLDINDSEVEIINIIIAAQNNYVRNNNKLNGPMKLKLEQSKLIGLQPIVISWLEWQNLAENERKIYIDLKITNALRQQ